MAQENEMSAVLKCVYFLALITILIGLITSIVTMVIIFKPQMWHDYRYEELRYFLCKKNNCDSNKFYFKQTIMGIHV